MQFTLFTRKNVVNAPDQRANERTNLPQRKTSDHAVKKSYLTIITLEINLREMIACNHEAIVSHFPLVIVKSEKENDVFIRQQTIRK